MLFDPFKLGPLTLKNRLVMSPMTRSRAVERVRAHGARDPAPRRALGRHVPAVRHMRPAAPLVRAQVVGADHEVAHLGEEPALLRVKTPDLFRAVLDGAHQRGGVTLELHPGRRQRGARLVADEQRAAQLAFERLDAGAHRRLTDMEPLGRVDEIAGRHHCQEGSGQFRVHAPFKSNRSISKAAFSQMSKFKRTKHLTPHIYIPIPTPSVGRTAAPASAERPRGRKVRAPSTCGAG